MHSHFSIYCVLFRILFGLSIYCVWGDLMKWKRICAGVSAGALAAACVIAPYDPVPVHADFGSFAGFVDYYYTTAGWSAASAIPGGLEVIAAYLMIKECLSNPITSDGNYDISNFTGGYGQYSHDGVLHQGMVCVPSGNYNIADGGIVIFNTDELSVSLSVPPGTNSLSAACIHSPNSTTWNNVLYADNSGGFYLTPLGSFTNSGHRFLCLSNAYFAVDSSGIPTWSPESLDFSRWFKNTSPKLGGVCITNLPSWDITPDSFNTYITDTLNPYLLREYPGTDTLIYAPEADPIYPTGDFVGIPKEWTIENPQLPTSPSIDFADADADFSIIDPSEAVSDNSTAFDFWWWLTSNVLDRLALKSIVLLFVGLGAVSYVLWKVGR